jgi:hypothetical protein
MLAELDAYSSFRFASPGSGRSGLVDLEGSNETDQIWFEGMSGY